MLQKRKPARMGVRDDVREFPQHRAWIRRHGCSVPGCDRIGIEAHHVRKGIPDHEAGGTALKPHDKWCVPLCREHHQENHDLGPDTFDRKHGIKLFDVAKEAQRLSPHRQRWEAI